MITLRQNNQDKLIAGTYSYATETLSPTVISGTIHAYRFGNVVQIFTTTSAASATEYTATESGMVVAHVIKSDDGNTCMLSINDELIDSFSYYSPTTSSTAGMCEITLTAFVRKGDKIKVYCDGNGDKYALANILIQTISWFI